MKFNSTNLFSGQLGDASKLSKSQRLLKRITGGHQDHAGKRTPPKQYSMAPQSYCRQVFVNELLLRRRRQTPGNMGGEEQPKVLQFAPNSSVSSSFLRSIMGASVNTSAEVTTLLIQWGNGDPLALEKLMPIVYAELRILARRQLRKEHPGQTLETTDLVHEAYLKLVNQRRVRWQNRGHFYAIAACVMRRILVDRARTRKRAKRGGGAAQVSLSQAGLAPEPEFDFVAFDEALDKLTQIDERKSKIVELRFFGGLSVEETAEFLDISPVTVMRDWRMAKAWLHKALNSEPSRFASNTEPDDSPDLKSTRN